MRLHAQSLSATFVLSLVGFVAGCSSDPGVPGSGWHQAGGSSGGSTSSGGSSSGASSGGSTSSSSGGSSSGASSSGSSGGSSSSGASSSGASSGGSTSSSGGSSTTITSNTTWTDGTTLAGSVTIASGATVTIAPGATVNVAANAAITVQGTLTASSATTHAKLTSTAWTGLVVDSGGTLTLDGVDLVNAATALQTNTGAVKAEYDDGTITASGGPFNIAKGTTLGTKHATVTGTKGASRIAGSLVASFLDYDSNGNEGIVTTDPTATESIEDSKLHGSGPVADMVVSVQGSSIHIAYTDVTNVHCGFHFDAIDSFDVSYTNVQSNSYGFMLYGSSGKGTRSVSYSNVDQNSIAYDTQGSNGPITFDHDYVTGTMNPGTAVSVTNAAKLAVTGTGPR